MTLTETAFNELKRDYAVYGTHTTTDRYGTERAEVDSTARGTIRTMFHPLTDASDIAEYGKDISSMYYAIVYDDTTIQHGDHITVYDEDYEVVAIKRFNLYRRIDVRRIKG